MGLNSSDKSEKIGLISRYANGLVRNHNSKFGVYFNSSTCVLNSLSIDEDNVLHGWYVSMVQHRGSSKNKAGLVAFAKEMKGIMKVHHAMIRTMKEPIILDLN